MDFRFASKSISPVPACPPSPWSDWPKARSRGQGAGVRRAQELRLQSAARSAGAKGLILPTACAEEAAVAKGLPVIPVNDLGQVVRFLLGEDVIEPAAVDIDGLWRERTTFQWDFSEVKGQEHAKWAMEIAAAGGHSLLRL